MLACNETKPHSSTPHPKPPTMAAPPCPLLSDGITDDTLLNIARFLPTARDLLCLMLSNKRFSIKVIAAPDGSGGGQGAAAAPEMLCIAEEAGRLWVAESNDQKRGWVPRRALESWLCLMHEVELLRLPLVFGRAHGDLTLFEGGAVATKNAGGSWRTAASTVVMRSGRHFAQLTVLEGKFLFFGVIRPGWDVKGRPRNMWTATASTCTARIGGAESPAATIGRECRPRRSRATGSACCSTSTRAALPSGRTTRSWG